MMRIMLDTERGAGRIGTDTQPGSFPRLTTTAYNRAKQRFGTDNVGHLAERLGFSRQSFWRVRRGEYDIPLSHARQVAHRLDMPLDRVFDGGEPHA